VKYYHDTEVLMKGIHRTLKLLLCQLPNGNNQWIHCNSEIHKNYPKINSILTVKYLQKRNGGLKKCKILENS